MNRSPINIYLILILLLGCQIVIAQPANDDCENAIALPLDIADYCSANEAFTNIDATESPQGTPACWGNANEDIWFTFIAVATDITITVNGDIGVAAGGTLGAPQISLLDETCSGTTSSLGCISDDTNVGIIQLYQGGLTPGVTYWIRIDGDGGSVGTFQLCINNYNPPVNPGSDCPVAAILCDKSSFIVQSVTGAGNDNTEMFGATCFGGSFTESNSTWFSWICETDGPLEFTLTPTNPIDDLDFVLYELPNGLDDCSGKIQRRCMAAGSGPFNFPTPCHGATGLSSTSVDVSESSGCNNGQDNFISPYDMEAGKAYSLVINNYTSTGNGFEMEFGGTGTLLGPEAGINSDAGSNAVCYGETITFTDASSFNLGNITEYNWSFSQDATPNNAIGTGPHQVSFTETGLKPVVLTLTTDRGCIITEIQYFEVDSCCATVNAVEINDNLTNLNCATDFNGSIDLTPNGALQPYSYQWSNAFVTEDLVNLSAGEYLVTVTNELGCVKTLGYEITTPPLIESIQTIVKPTCDGGQDGSISLNTEGGIAPYQYNWQNAGFTSNNNITNLPIGTYNVIVEDGVDCQSPLNIEVNELVLELNSTVQAIDIPTCNGGNDGSITLSMSNGLAPYLYDWQDANGFVTNNQLDNIPSGNFPVNVIDANNCQGVFNFDIIDHPDILLNINTTDASCFGQDDGLINVLASGGVPDYNYQWSNNLLGSEIIGLEAGQYTITVTDIVGCPKEEIITIGQPNQIFAQAENLLDVSCYGLLDGSFDINGFGGSPGYTYSLDGISYQDSVHFEGLNAGFTTMYVKDTLGCVGTGEVEIVDPLPLLVSLGDNLSLDLGYSVALIPVHSPASSTVTYSWFDMDLDSIPCDSLVGCDKLTVQPTETTNYTIQIVDETGCIALDKIKVNVIPERPIFIPTGFSPNNDSENDYFTAFGGIAAKQISRISVFDRWGTQLFNNENIPLNSEIDGWDGYLNGQALPVGVYMYFIEIEFLDGEFIIYQGDITIMK